MDTGGRDIEMTQETSLTGSDDGGLGREGGPDGALVQQALPPRTVQRPRAMLPPRTVQPPRAVQPARTVLPPRTVLRRGRCSHRDGEPPPTARRVGRRPTMKQVAAVAGVSLATVSRVVNGGPRVRPDLAARVPGGRAARLPAQPDRQHAAARRPAVGEHRPDLRGVANPFFSAVHRGVEDVARKRGVLTFVGSSDEGPSASASWRRRSARAASTASSSRPPRPTTAICSATARPAWRSSSSIGRRASSTPTAC